MNPPTSVHDLATGVQYLVSHIDGWGTYLVAVGTISTLTMAILQTLKDLLPIRMWFHQIRMRIWLDRQVKIDTSSRVAMDRAAAEAQLVRLATNGDRRAFYSLEIEKLCGQWSSGLQIVMDYPGHSPELFYCMSVGAAAADVRYLLDHSSQKHLAPKAQAVLSPVEQQELVDYQQCLLSAQQRVRHQMQRAIDAFQISTTFRWTWYFQVLSFGVSIGLAWIALNMVSGLPGPDTILTAIIAGFLAPVARDLFARIKALNP
jgi:hypothetical protein